MATSFTSIRLFIFLLLLLLSPSITHASDELTTSSDSVNLFMRLSRRNPPSHRLSHPSKSKPRKFKQAAKKISKKKFKKKPKNHYNKKPIKANSMFNPALTYAPVRASVPAPVLAPAPAAIPVPVPAPAPAPIQAAIPAPIPAPVSSSAALPAAIPAPLSAPKVAPNPNPTLSAQPQTISAQPPKAHPQAPHPVMNLHPSLPTYGQEASLGSDIDRWVKGHNKVRKMYTVADVTWNPQLALAAARQADTCYFKHTPQNRYGENIAAGQQSIEQVMNEWVFGPGERDSYVRTDPTSHSHYTQVVWADTKQIGCAVKTCNQFGGAALGPGPVKFWVCEYDPPGNVLGWSAKKVHAATGGAPLSAYAANYKHRRGHRFSSSKH